MPTVGLDLGTSRTVVRADALLPDHCDLYVMFVALGKWSFVIN